MKKKKTDKTRALLSSEEMKLEFWYQVRKTFSKSHLPSSKRSLFFLAAIIEDGRTATLENSEDCSACFGTPFIT